MVVTLPLQIAMALQNAANLLAQAQSWLWIEYVSGGKTNYRNEYEFSPPKRSGLHTS
jgi:hypothetical protein